MKEPFHERLLRLRKAKGWTLSHLSKKSQLSKEIIKSLESDSRQVPSWLAISKLAAALGTNPVYLATGDGNVKPFHVPLGYLAESARSRKL